MKERRELYNSFSFFLYSFVCVRAHLCVCVCVCVSIIAFTYGIDNSKGEIVKTFALCRTEICVVCQQVSTTESVLISLSQSTGAKRQRCAIMGLIIRYANK